MFIIEVNGKKHLWHNSLEDDFLQFLPNHFGCEPKDITVHALTKEEAKEAKRFMKESGNGLVIEQGKMKLAKMTLGEMLEPELKVGDEDPDKPGKLVKENDPRTLPKQADPTIDVKKELKLKKVEWPYDENGKFLGHELKEI